MPTEVLEERQLPRSAVRHRPIAPDATQTHVKTPRASRARQHHEPHTTGGPPSVHTSKARGIWLVYLVLGMLLACLLLWVGQIVWSWGNTTMDDLHYGRPRTFQMDAFVGHEMGTVPSHFIALNLHGHIEIIELPGGDATHAKIYIGPQIYGPGADLVPVTLRFVDPSQSHHPDMLVLFQGDQIVFHNVEGGFQQASSALSTFPAQLAGPDS